MPVNADLERCALACEPVERHGEQARHGLGEAGVSKSKVQRRSPGGAGGPGAGEAPDQSLDHLGLGGLYAKAGKPNAAQAELLAAIGLYREMDVRVLAREGRERAGRYGARLTVGAAGRSLQIR